MSAAHGVAGNDDRSPATSLERLEHLCNHRNLDLGLIAQGYQGPGAGRRQRLQPDLQ